MAAGGQKLVAVVVFLVCMVVLSGVKLVPKVEAGVDPKYAKLYNDCFDPCQTACIKGGRGYTDCEMKCDTECTKKALNAEINKIDSEIQKDS